MRDKSLKTPLLLALGAAIVLVGGFVFFQQPRESGKETQRSPAGPSSPLASNEARTASVSETGASRETPVVPPDDAARSVETPPNPLLVRLSALSSDPVERQTQLEKLLAEIPSSDLERTLNLLWDQSVSGPAREFTGRLVRRWAAETPALAASWITHQPPGPLQQELALAIATIWANEKAAEATDWVRNWPESQKEAGITAVAYEIARTSPTNALWLASELSAGDARDELIRHAVGEWASADANLPIAWAAKMENSPLRTEVLATATLALSESDPEAAARLAIQALPEGRKKDITVVGIVQRWTQKEPEKAADWVKSFPPGQLRDSAAENVVNLWSDQALDKPAEWLDTLEGPTRDAAVSTYVGKLAAVSPPTAAVWAESIADPALRLRELERLGERWLAVDGPTAKAWLQKAPLSEEVKARMLAQSGGQPTQRLRTD